MLLHDNYIPFFVNLQAVVVFHIEVKCTNCIFCVKCISIMADSDKTLIGDSNLSNNNRKSSAPNIVPSSTGTVCSDTHPTHHIATSEPSTLKRKQTSFQITSVTVKGSRLSTDGGEDSADDLDESHTEDVSSSEILDCSKTTDVDNDHLLSEDCTNVNNDESSVHAPSIPVKCRTESPVTQDAQKIANNFPSESSKDDKPSERNQSQHVVNTPALPDQWQHRFRVVKIVSSEPFKRGRWLCMDFMDPPAPAVEVKPEVSESTTSSGTQIVPSTCFPDINIPTDRVAHIYEISPSDAYPGSISVAVGPDQIQQPMYGIFLPVNNGHYPFISGVNTAAVTLQKEVKQPEPLQPATSAARVMQQQPQFTASQTTTLSEAQTPFPGQQTQAVTTTASQQPQPVQPPVTVQMVTQHQSQTTVKAQTPVTTMQQAAVSASAAPSPLTSVTSTPPTISPQSQESQLNMQQRVQQPSPPVVAPQSQPVPVSANQTVPLAPSSANVVSSTSQASDLQQHHTQAANPQIPPPATSMSGAQTSSVGTQASAVAAAATAAPSNIPEVTPAPTSIKTQEPPAAVPSQQPVQNHTEVVQELGTPPSSSPPQSSQEILSETPPAKADVNGEDPESVPSGTSTVAIDNKIEQAMDLVKSHLMFAVREEVDVLKEKITELMDRISQLEYENGFLRANASQQTLEQLNQSQLLQQQQQQNQPSSVSINSVQVTQQPIPQQQLNIQNPQSTS